MQSTRILLLCIGVAVLYGVIHDQFTARICLEYFTVAHPFRIVSQSPSVVGLYWGFAATWWVGAILGLLLTIACRAGHWPRLSAGQLVRPVYWLFVSMALCAFLAGTSGYFLIASGKASLEEWNSVIPPHRQARFAAALYSHFASYVSGIQGGIILVACALCWRKRLRSVAHLAGGVVPH